MLNVMLHYITLSDLMSYYNIVQRAKKVTVTTTKQVFVARTESKTAARIHAALKQTNRERNRPTHAASEEQTGRKQPTSFCREESET